MPHKRAKFSVRMADRASKGKDLAPTTSNRLEIATMPKGAMRILQAEQVQKAYHERRRQQEEERLRAKSNGKGKGKEADGATVEKEELRMRPGERARDFNRRVEDAYAGEISQTIKATSSSTSKKRDNKKKRRQPDAGDDDDDDADERFRKRRATNDGKDRGPSKADLKKEREALEFEKASQRRSVNDVVQAPPTLTKAPRGEGAAAKKRKAELRALLSGGEVQQEKEKARLPEPIHKAAGGGLRRQKDLVDERDRAIKAYRSQKQRQQQQ